MKEFKLNDSIINEIKTTGTLKGVTDRFSGCKVIRDTLTNVLVGGFDDLNIGNSCYITIPVCFATSNNYGIDVNSIITKAGISNEILKLEWIGMESIQAEVYFEYKFELIPNPNKDIDGVDDNVLMLHYYLVIPEGLIDAALEYKYTPQYISMQVANLLMKQLVR